MRALQGLVSGARRLYPNLMRTLFHFPLDPNCRIIRLMLGEKRLDFRSAAPTMAPTAVMEIPTSKTRTARRCLHDGDRGVPDETYPEPPLIGRDIIERAETRRLTHYLLSTWRRDQAILFEGEADGPAGRARQYGDVTAVQLSSQYLGLIEELYENRNWIAGVVLPRRPPTVAQFGARLRGSDRVGPLPGAAPLVRAG